MAKFLEETKDARLAKEKLDSFSSCRRLVDAYTQTRPSNEIVPRVGDIYRMEGIRDIVEGTPHEELLTADSFGDFFLCLPELS